MKHAIALKKVNRSNFLLDNACLDWKFLLLKDAAIF